MLNRIFSAKTISIFTAIIFITSIAVLSAAADSISGNVVDNTGRDFVQSGNVWVEAWSHHYEGWYGTYVDSDTGDYRIWLHGDSGYRVRVTNLDTGYWGATTMPGFENQPRYDPVWVGPGDDLSGYNFEIREDHIPPVITDIQIEGTPKAGEDIIISAIVTDDGGSGVWGGWMRFRRPGGDGWPHGHWNFDPDEDGRWRGYIPSWIVTTAGVEYHIGVPDEANNHTFHPPDGENNPEYIPVEEPSDATISGTVTDDSNPPNPLEGAWVSAWQHEDERDAYAQTDENGDYTLEVAAGTWNIDDVGLYEYYPINPPRRPDPENEPFWFSKLYGDIEVVSGDYPGYNVVMARDDTPPEISLVGVAFDAEMVFGDALPESTEMSIGILTQSGSTVEVEVRDDESGVYDGEAWFRWRFLDDWGFNENQLYDEEEGARDNIFKGDVDFDQTGIIEYFFEAVNTANLWNSLPSPRPDDNPNGKNHGYYALVIFQNPSSKAIYYSDNSTFNGDPIDVGTIISAANPRGVFCGGWIVKKTGKYGYMDVYGDGDEGMQDGETPNFFIFDEANRHNARVRYLSGDDATWHQGDWLNVNLEGYSAKRKLIPLEQNWNLIGISGEPNDGDTSVESVLRSIDGQYDVVIGYDETGALVYDASSLPMEFNTLTEIDDVHGFYILMNNPAILDIDVAITPPEKPIEVVSGLNLVSYLPEDGRDVATALASIDGMYDWVRGFDPRSGGVQFYEPGNTDFSTLGKMHQPFSYFINMTQEAQLIYNPSAAAPSVYFRLPPSDFRLPVTQDVIPTTSMVFFYGGITVDGQPAPRGTEVIAYDPDGVKVGKFIVRKAGKFGFMPVYQDENFTPDVDEGANVGDTIKFFINGQPASVDGDATWTRFGDRIKINLKAGNLFGKAIEKKFALWRNYPNPFNPETWIPYQLAKSADVTISIYNVRGRLIRKLHLGKQLAGAYLSKERAAHWDGRNERGELVSSGVYFYSIQAGNFKATRKFVILK